MLSAHCNIGARCTPVGAVLSCSMYLKTINFPDTVMQFDHRI